MDSVPFILLIEEEINLRNLRRERSILRNQNDPMDLNDVAFLKNFRLNKTAFSYVLEELERVMPQPEKCHGLKAKDKLCALLRLLAEGGYQHGVGQEYEIAMAQSTISTHAIQTLDILERILCPRWICLNMTNADKERAKINFYNKSCFPGVVMCVDGTHVKIIPPENKYLFYNRKGFYSMNVMLLCDDQTRIRAVDARFPGCNHDSHIWNLSDAKRHFEEEYRTGERNTWILGDAGYPLEPWLITPFRSPSETSLEGAFNKKHAKARNVVERTIGVLKNRFRCLLGARQLHYSPERVVKIINVCCALHNICLSYNADIDEAKFVNPEIGNENLEQSESAVLFNEAVGIRNRILNSL